MSKTLEQLDAEQAELDAKMAALDNPPEPTEVAPEAGEEMSNADYHALPGVSNSKLKVFMREGARQYHHQFISGNYVAEKKAHFDFGDVLHEVCLFGEHRAIEIPKEVLSKSGAKSGHTWKEFAEENAGKILLKSSELAEIMGARDAVYSDPMAALLLNTPGICEKVFKCHDARTGLDLRMKLDKLVNVGGSNIVLDLKSCGRGTDGRSFAKVAADLFYDCQEYVYRKILEASGIQVDYFVFIAVGSKAPHTVDCHNIGSMQGKAAADVEYALEALSDRIRSGNWHSKHRGEIQPTEPPKFHVYRELAC